MHRKIEWDVVITAALIGVISILVHWFMGKDKSIRITGNDTFYKSVGIGVAVMIAVYMIGHNMIAKYAKEIALFMFFILIFLRLQPDSKYLGFGSARVITAAVLCLYVPVYGAILHKYRGDGIIALLKAILWMIVPIVVIHKSSRVITEVALLAAMMMQLLFCIKKRWFKIHLISFLAAVAVITFAVKVFMDKSGLLGRFGRKTISNVFSIDENVVQSFFDVNFVGGSGEEKLKFLPKPDIDFLLTYQANRYGLLPAIGIALLVIAVITFGYKSVIRCKNDLGFLMGTGCLNVLLENTVINIFENMGKMPYTDTFLPFFSSQTSYIVMAYIFVGIILSVGKGRYARERFLKYAMRNLLRC
ncbi:MAG: FtsW/RodA/SpoVE family cell cycle protein [Butyrivibrio sp.]|nr:FtsW/RodA/SpoVE family cell cycle protein [Butyrivibrio sp.]